MTGRTVSERVGDWLTRFRWPLLLVAAALVAAAVAPANRLELERSIESLYSPGDPRLAAYTRSRELFGGDEFVLVAWDQENPTEPESLDAIAAFAAELSRVPGVNPASTQDLSKVLRPALEPGLKAVVLRRMIPLWEPQLMELSEGVIVSADRRTVAVVLRLTAETPDQPITGPGSRAETFREIRTLAAAHDPPAFVAGEPIQVHDAFEAVEYDGRVLFYVSLALLGAVLLFLLRSLRWVLIPLAVVLAAIVWTRATLELSGLRLSMVSSMLNSLVCIVGVATVMHVALRFRELRRLGGAPDSEVSTINALRETFSQLAAPIFWSCATTAAGFLSLLAADLTPVRSFGLMMGLGAGAVLVATLSFTPGLALAGGFDSTPRGAPGEGLLGGLLGWGPGAILKFKRPLAVVTVLLTVFSLTGALRLKVETDFSKNFKSDSEIVRSLNYIEDRLGGAGSWEVNVPAPGPGEPLREAYLNRIRDLAAELRALEVGGRPAFTKVVALTDTLDTVPLIGSSVRDRLDQLAEFAPEVEPSLYNPEARRMRIVLRSRERQSAGRKRAVIERTEALARQHFPGTETAKPASATGLFVLLTYLIESLLRDQIVSFAWASVGLFGMMWAAFRSLKLAVASMLPNLLPIGLVLGGLGWIGLPVNIGTAMIASVSVGLTVDGNVHYIAAYLRQRRLGASRREALKIAHGTVGRAMTFAVLALACGFAALTLSQFVPLIYFGALVSLAMLGGLIGDLVLLPLMIGWREE
ncbi:RND family transporter [Alienimonas sp. DA493]|uniref:efflux RND transporter permease subunit n=1 Tax=Alienimonas sp. DA493 TaxID=3373605 RepID=UPI00375504BC